MAKRDTAPKLHTSDEFGRGLRSKVRHENEVMVPSSRMVGHQSFMAGESPDRSSHGGSSISHYAEGHIDTNTRPQASQDDERFSAVDGALHIHTDESPDRSSHGGSNISHYAEGHINERDTTNTRPQASQDDERFSGVDGALHIHTDASSDRSTVVDISKLEIQHTSSSQDVPQAMSEAFTPRSAPSRRKRPEISSTPSGYHVELLKKVSFGSTSSKSGTNSAPQEQPPIPLHYQPAKQHSKKKSFSHPTPATSKNLGMMTDGGGSGSFQRLGSHDLDGAKQENYAMFRTKSAKLERQLSRLQSRQQQEGREESYDVPGKRDCSEGSMSAGRYFDALKGPELEILKDSEELLLPLGQPWPFLLRFPIGCFGICLGLGSQTILWKTLATSASMSFLHVPLEVNFSLWCLALVTLVTIFTTYTLKCILYFEAVRREYYHPVRVNFFFAPWIACMFLTLGIPPSITAHVHPSLWCVFMTPLLILELKIYGQWLSGGQRRLSKVANPSTHLSLVGNFVSALLAAVAGWKEPAIFFWAVGCAHYLVLFVTLYQRLPSAEALPKELHPVFFLFVAAPSTASVAWKYIVGDFDRVSRMAYFVALFLYSSLVVRIKFFCGIQFSIAWWAYTFPMTASAIATIHYSLEIRHPFTQALAVILSVISTLTVISLFVSTILHGMWGSVFPNDIAIAITNKRHKRKHKRAKAHCSNGTSADKISDTMIHPMESANFFLKEGKTPLALLQHGAASDAKGT